MQFVGREGVMKSRYENKCLWLILSFPTSRHRCFWIFHGTVDGSGLDHSPVEIMRNIHEYSQKSIPCSRMAFIYIYIICIQISVYTYIHILFTYSTHIFYVIYIYILYTKWSKCELFFTFSITGFLYLSEFPFRPFVVNRIWPRHPRSLGFAAGPKFQTSTMSGSSGLYYPVMWGLYLGNL